MRGCRRGALALVMLLAPLRAGAAAAAVDWPAFLSRHDLVWRRLPQRWEDGAWLGNGLLGAMVFAEGKGALCWQLGRSDVTEHADRADPLLARARLPIGRMVLQTAGEIRGFEARLDLWNAELRATLTTDRGVLRIASFIHAEEPLLVVELEPEGGESEARFTFRPDLAFVERLALRNLPITAADLNPPPFVEEHGPARVSVQPRRSGGEYAVAWQQTAEPGGGRRLVVSIADSYPGPGARRQALQAVVRASAGAAADLRASHRAFWHAYYPASFVSLPDTRLEGFYWIQMHKLAAATRADRPAIDTLGPWYHTTPWPGVWWNLNIQLSYWPVYAANRPALGESLLRLLDRNQGNLRRNVPEAWRGDSMAVGRMGGPDALSPVEYVGPLGPGNGAHEMSNLVWVMHNSWLHWRHTMDAALLREHLYPLLKASVAYLLHRLERGPDGRLHLPEALSPEYPRTAPDTNYDLALLRWGCQTLLELSRRLGAADPMEPAWQRTLEELAPYPEGPDGYLIGRGQPLAESHRHFSHLLMVYPLQLVTPSRPEDRARIERSLRHWIGFEGALQGYSFVGASAISSLLGRGDDAARHLDDLIGRFVLPNTMYREAGPVIETPLAAAQAVHEMLLQSHGGRLRVFPAVPARWREVAFADLRAQGAFLVSAVRREGRTACVHVTSLAGEPATLEVEDASVELVAPGQEALGRNAWRLSLARGQSVLVAPRGTRLRECLPGPVPAQAAQVNAFGLR
jgi:alpha-L-fucosidase 2